MNRYPPAPEAVPFTLGSCSPVAQNVHLIKQNDRSTMGARDRLGTCPHAVPEARQGSLRAVARRVESHRTGLPGELQEERGLPHLARPGQELDPSRRSFGQTPQKEASAVLVVHRESIIE